jgi:YfiR/HmsC-like
VELPQLASRVTAKRIPEPIAGQSPSRRAFRGRWHAVLIHFFILGALAGSASALAQNNSTREYEIKAAFLFHFAQFVEWPEETFKDAGSPLIFCTLGEDPFHGALDVSLNGKTIDARSLRVLHLKPSQSVQVCQVLFLGAAENKLIPAAMSELKGKPVLTVGETEHFVLDGGMIGFSLDENKIRFAINLQAAGKAKLKISSKLLSLAKAVIGTPGGA